MCATSGSHRCRYPFLHQRTVESSFFLTGPPVVFILWSLNVGRYYGLVQGTVGVGQGCIRMEGTSEAAPEEVRQAVGGGCQSGWERLQMR